MAKKVQRGVGPHVERLPEFFDATYDLETDDQDWLVQVMESMRSVWGQDGPMHGAIYDVSDIGVPILRLHLTGFDDQRNEGIRHRSGPSTIPRRLSGHTAPSWSPVLQWVPSPTSIGRALGYPDSLHINGRDPNGHGAFISLWEPRSSNATAALTPFYRRIARHLGAAHRCRRRLRVGQAGDCGPVDAATGAEAILDRRGRIVHAAGVAKTQAAQAAILETWKARDRVRAKPADIEQNLQRWTPLIRARWTLVDSFDRDGSRYVVARENQIQVRGLAALTERERQVVAYLAIGQSTKEIAYTLGISDVTVRVLLTRAAAKLRVGSRAGLLEHPEVRALQQQPTHVGEPRARPRRR